MTSLRARLMLWLMLLMTVAGILGGLGAYVIGLHQPDEEFDGQLRQIAINIGAGTSGLDPRESADIEAEDVVAIQVWDGSGKQTRTSDPAVALARQATTGFRDLDWAGATWRVYTSVHPERTVQIAQRTAIRREIAADSAFRAVYPVLALIPLSWLVIGLVVSRLLLPLRRLVADLAARQAGSASPLSLAALPREVAPLVAAVNDLLQRQHALLDFRQRFLSDTAHQLRTPLTASKLQAENLRYAASLGDARDLAADIERGLKRMGEMINQLLDLARADAPDRPAPAALHDLDAIVQDAIEDVLVLADRRAIDIGMTTARAVAPIVCDRPEIRMLLGNLLDNAVRHTPPRGQVDVALEVSRGSAIIRITDTGPGIPEADAGRLFDRFVRLGTADTEGSGLGLAIVKAIATRHAARVEVRNRHDRSGLSASVVFPMASGG